jgi:2-polyprenyl-3-methyl-5-hydroxy-6-metoxy-1,4-benzoquinol methylase
MGKPIQWTPELVERFWTGVSQTRLSDLSFSRGAAPYLIELIGDHLKPQGRHLDFGAGDGDLVRALIQKGYATAACEPIGVRSAKIPRDIADHPNYLGLIKDGSAERFDVVLMIEVIEHVLEEDLDGALRKVRSLLAKDGTLIVSTPNAEDLDLSSAYCPNCDTLFHRWQHVRSFTPQSLSALLLAYGFECLFLHEVDFSDSRFPIEELKKAIRFRQLVEKRELQRRKDRTVVGRIKKVIRVIRGRQQVIDVDASAEEESKNLRIGTQSHLVYIGRRV